VARRRPARGRDIGDRGADPRDRRSAAVEFFDRYLGTALAGPPIANPLAVFQTADSPFFHLRTATNLDRESGDVSVFGPIEPGVVVQLTVAGSDEIIDGARASIGGAMEGFPDGRAPEAVLMYSCVVRRFLLGTRAAREIELVRQVVGPDVPVAGFYCMGEIAPLPPADVPQFHNATMVSVLLGSR
jgi:hypothetical protein